MMKTKRQITFQHTSFCFRTASGLQWNFDEPKTQKCFSVFRDHPPEAGEPPAAAEDVKPIILNQILGSVLFIWQFR
jgi:hypothetical protein